MCCQPPSERGPSLWLPRNLGLWHRTVGCCWDQWWPQVRVVDRGGKGVGEQDGRSEDGRAEAVDAGGTLRGLRRPSEWEGSVHGPRGGLASSGAGWRRMHGLGGASGHGRVELRAECRKPEEGPWSCQVVEGWAEPRPVSWKAALAAGVLGC